MSEDLPHRRDFFREALAGIVKPLAECFQEGSEPPPDRLFLRPPGAIDEGRFLDTCYRCASCVEVCPAKAISLRHVPSHPADGTPGIDPDLAACVVCDGLKCTHACPSGALVPLKRAYEIDMGLAMVSAERCLRAQGEACTECVDKCPIGAAAIRIANDGPPNVSASACIGCGVCQLHCPTQPKAVVVELV
ncbi:MAG: 4Fe-4S dicluster domain-containing protein [bacterium]|nr:4Fe-4S dicluster domain-containing protein [bacterium]